MKTGKLPEENLYSIAQVNAITGVAKPTIRFWEKEFKDFLKHFSLLKAERKN